MSRSVWFLGRRRIRSANCRRPAGSLPHRTLPPPPALPSPSLPPSSRMTPSTLPDDVLRQVVEELGAGRDVTSLARCCLASRALRDDARRFLYQHIDMGVPSVRPRQLSPPPEFYYASEANARLLRSIRLCAFGPTTDSQLGALLSACALVEKMYVNGPSGTAGMLRGVLENNPHQIRSFALLSQSLTPEPEMANLLRHLPSLRVLYLAEFWQQEPFPSPPTFRLAKLRLNRPTTRTHLSYLLSSSAATLRQLHVWIHWDDTFSFPFSTLTDLLYLECTLPPLAINQLNSSSVLDQLIIQLRGCTTLHHFTLIDVRQSYPAKIIGACRLLHHLPSSLITVDARSLDIPLDHLLDFLSTMRATHPQLRQLKLKNFVVDCEKGSWSWRA